MCRMCAISMCLLEKYFARIRMRMSFTGSTGCTLNGPKSNQLCAPLTTVPAPKRSRSSAAPKRKNAKSTSLRRRNRQSMKLPTKKTTRETRSQMSCLKKNKLLESSVSTHRDSTGENTIDDEDPSPQGTKPEGSKEYMVTRPAAIMGRSARKSTQSMECGMGI